MKSYRLAIVFAGLSLVACGSNNDHTPSASAAGTAIAQPTTQINSEPMPSPPNVTVNNANSNTSAIVGNSNDANSTAHTIPTPSPTPPATALFTGTWPAATIGLVTDGCGGSCGASVTLADITVTHDAQGYHAIAGSTIEPAFEDAHIEGITWNIDGPGPAAGHCQATTYHFAYGLGTLPSGRPYYYYSTESDSTGCGGGHDYVCKCEYATR